MLGLWVLLVSLLPLIFENDRRGAPKMPIDLVGCGRRQAPKICVGHRMDLAAPPRVPRDREGALAEGRFTKVSRTVPFTSDLPEGLG